MITPTFVDTPEISKLKNEMSLSYLNLHSNVGSILHPDKAHPTTDRIFLEWTDEDSKLTYDLVSRVRSDNFLSNFLLQTIEEFKMKLHKMMSFSFYYESSEKKSSNYLTIG